MFYFHILFILLVDFILGVFVVIILWHVQLCLTYAFELYFGLGFWFLSWDHFLFLLVFNLDFCFIWRHCRIDVVHRGEVTVQLIWILARLVNRLAERVLKRWLKRTGHYTLMLLLPSDGGGMLNCISSTFDCNAFLARWHSFCQVLMIALFTHIIVGPSTLLVVNVERQ